MLQHSHVSLDQYTNQMGMKYRINLYHHLHIQFHILLYIFHLNGKYIKDSLISIIELYLMKKKMHLHQFRNLKHIYYCIPKIQKDRLQYNTWKPDLRMHYLHMGQYILLLNYPHKYSRHIVLEVHSYWLNWHRNLMDINEHIY